MSAADAQGRPMTGKKRAKETKPPCRVAADDPGDLNGRLKNVGGSRSDHWNNILAEQVVQALWLKHSDPATREKQFSATVAALIGIRPQDELEGMIAAQLIAAHNAAMECYRRAMLGEQTFEGHRENLTQANKLSRTYAVLLEALNRHRGKGQQKVTVEHVHVNAGGRAIVGVVNSPEVYSKKSEQEADAARAIAYAPDTALRCSDPEREAVPIAGGVRQTPL